MYKLIDFFSILFLPFSSVAQEPVESEQNVENVVEYNHRFFSEPKFEELTPEEDDLYDGTEIKPLEKELSATEKLQNTSTDVGFIEKEDELPDLPCTDLGLKEQVESFIYNNIKEQKADSVLEKRSRILLVKNMRDFAEISEKELQKKADFEASAAVAYLKINKKSPITHICASKDNANSDFKDIFVIIYPYANYYKVIVANLISTPETMDEATFIYNWK